jgi:hypothetical protein
MLSRKIEERPTKTAGIQQRERNVLPSDCREHEERISLALVTSSYF